MNYKQILFCDLDGVMYAGQITGLMNKPCLDALRKILAETEAMIVITSTRRTGGGPTKMRELFLKSGAKDICGRILSITPNISGKNRVEEILTWMIQNQYTGKYAVVDDFDLTFGFKSGMFITKFDDGLTVEIADKIIEYLNKGD